jgi:hypothetical protein
MARHVYFSFHYEKDVWRTNQVRNSWVCKPNKTASGFYDRAEFESVKKQGPAAIKRWINKNLEGTSVTVVVVGEETCNRKWVRYEIEQSIKRNNGIIFVKVHNLKDQNGQTCQEGEMDFGIDISEYPVYDWVDDGGYDNLGDWIDSSALAQGRQELGPPTYRYSKRTACGRT